MNVSHSGAMCCIYLCYFSRMLEGGHIIYWMLEAGHSLMHINIGCWKWVIARHIIFRILILLIVRSIYYSGLVLMWEGSVSAFCLAKRLLVDPRSTPFMAYVCGLDNDAGLWLCAVLCV